MNINFTWHWQLKQYICVQFQLTFPIPRFRFEKKKLSCPENVLPNPMFTVSLMLCPLLDTYASNMFSSLLDFRDPKKY